MTLSFNTLRTAVVSCTSYDLKVNPSGFALIDPYGDQDGDDFETLEDVYDFIINNTQVAEFLSAFDGWLEVHA